MNGFIVSLGRRGFGVVVLFLVFVLSGCSKEDEGLGPDNMSIARFEPLAALSGDTIVIVGQGFDQVAVKNVVQFNASSKTAVVLSVDAAGTRLEVIVPADAQAGNVKVAAGPYSTLSNLPFLLSPSIGSVNPDGALPGEQITISGKNFTTNLSKLLIYIADVEIDSIFGGSSTQIIFPLPEGLPVGPTTIRVGTRLTQTDSVLSPPVEFTVFDPLQPVLANLVPSQGEPGAQFTINGNAFNVVPGKTYVLFGTEQIESTAFVSISSGKIVLNVPPDFVVSGLGQVNVDVRVGVRLEDEDLISSPLPFTVLEPSNLEFYYGAINGPGAGSPALADDFVYKASPTPGGSPIKIELFQANNITGIEVNDDASRLYYTGGTLSIKTLPGLTNLPTNPSDEAFPQGDIAVDNTSIIFDALDDNIKKYNLTTEVVQDVITSSTTSPSLKIDGNNIYYFRTSKIVGRVAKDGSNDIQVVAGTPDPGQLWVALAVGQGKVYIAEGPLEGFINSSAPVGNSKILMWDGASLSVLYTLTGKVVTDIELSKDGSTLYWMVAGENGAIESAPVPAAVPGEIEVIIPGIRNGRYFDVFERD